MIRRSDGSEASTDGPSGNAVRARSIVSIGQTSAVITDRSLYKSLASIHRDDVLVVWLLIESKR